MKKIVNDERLMAQICDLYYNKNMDQKQIAKHLRLSRPTISRMLTNARELGVVSIQIKYLDETQYMDLERLLEDAYKLQDVIIVESNDNKEQMTKDVGKAASLYLHRIIQDDDIVGISMGNSLYEVVNSMEKGTAKNVTFFPMIGGMGFMRTELHSNTLAERMSRIYGGLYYPMHAPARVSNPLIRRELLKEKSISDVIYLGNRLTVAINGIGASKEDSLIMATGYYDKKDLQKLRDKHVAGDICMQFYDINGDATPYKSDNTIIGVDIKKLKKVPYSIGVACGEDKANGILGAIRGKYINTLITDERTARKLYEMHERDD